ncbi:SIR2 family protein [Yersinia enterocolitica]|nr:SIR2 family protein [Yersinia enterocolitica]HEF7264612.1 SIR2 family protein [Yersinia enterocolitica]HEI6972958.1 SIR2 family protein [Yersinia enterocolitica]HEM9134733.1 SIR2 family protein [Yersinia enterocolitica]HEN3352923.1 SIR2 family protein [Yersinia enterocolitica]
MDYLDEITLSKKIQKAEPFSIVLGAALTSEVEGKGIPGVERVPDFVFDFIKSKDDIEDYQQAISSKTSQDKYQASLQYVSDMYGQNAVNTIINEVVRSNIDKKTGKSFIPAAIKGLAKLIEIGKIKSILTTNFDTLIEEELDNLDIKYNSISIVSDSNITTNSNNLPTIVHLHGKWNEGDTMHTQSQLNNNRDKIQNSIRSIISKENIYIMAYGGWEDSFTRTLANIVHDNDANYDISWCFYNSDPVYLDKTSKELFTKLSPAIQRGRVKFFKGINCHSIFTKINIEKAKKKHK